MSFSAVVHPNTGRGTQVWHTFNNTVYKNTNPLIACLNTQTWLTDLKSTSVNPLRVFRVFYCSMFAPCQCGRAVLCVSSIKLEKLVGRGEALLLQTHYTHTRMEASFLFFFFSSFPFWTNTLQDCNSFLSDHVIAQVRKVWLILHSNSAGSFFPFSCFYFCVLVSILEGGLYK